MLLPGAVKNPPEYLTRAEFFVLSSRTEGFPNELCEAMAWGLPVIAADCVSGPREIVRHEVDGLLVPVEDVDALARAMDRMMTDPSLRTEMGKRAPDVLARFGVDTIMRQWEMHIAQTRRARRRARD